MSAASPLASRAEEAPGAELVLARDLHRSFDGRPVLEGVSLSVPEQSVSVVLGGSGSGKSTLLRHLIGLEQPDRGSVRLMGQELAGLSRDEHARLLLQTGMLFQDGALFDSMDVASNVGFALRTVLHRPEAEVQRVVREKLLMVGLKNAGAQYPSELSGGMRKRVALARAIAHDPRLIFVDEPTSGLDPIMADTINELLLQLRDRLGMSVLCITHDVPAAFKIADRISMLFQGQVLATGSPEQIREHPSPVVQQFLAGRTHGPITP